MSNALSVLTAGLPISAKGILEEAMSIAFSGSVEVQELTRENLRSRVRLSSKNSGIVLVILDSVSSDMCKDIENGLYSSDKYYAYSSDKELINFLNNRYHIDLKVEEDVEDIPISEKEVVSFNDEYISEQLKAKDDIIKNLETRINDLFNFYGDDLSKGVSNEELDVIKDENIALNDEVLELKSTVDTLRESISGYEEENNSLVERCSSLEEKIDSLNDLLSSKSKEIDDLRIANTKMPGLLRDKDAKIQDLTRKLEKHDKDSEKISILEDRVSELKRSLSTSESEVGELRVDLQSKEKEVARYRTEIDTYKQLGDVNDELKSANTTIESLNSEISIITKERDTLKKGNKDKERTISQLSESNETLEKELDEVKTEVETLNNRIQEDDIAMLQLNQDKIELGNRLELLEKASNSNDEVNDLLKDISDLQDKIAVLSSNVFNRIGQTALPSCSVNASILSGKGKLQNVSFVFSGNAESRKGTYKSLLNELKYGSKEDRYLIVDLVSETSIDYVFEMPKVISGVDWFARGGSIQKYISNTVLKNVKVLSLGLGFINDSYFLCIDWAKRLAELDKSGYKVIIYCGDLSNTVGRVLYTSFVSFGETSIYVHGNAVGCRTIVTNLRGLVNAKESKVLYYDYNQAFHKFFNMVSRTNECRVISSKGSAR